MSPVPAQLRGLPGACPGAGNQDREQGFGINQTAPCRALALGERFQAREVGPTATRGRDPGNDRAISPAHRGGGDTQQEWASRMTGSRWGKQAMDRSRESQAPR